MLVADLIKLGEKSLEMFTRYINEKTPISSMRVFVRHFPTELEISETQGRCTSSAEFIYKPDWSKVIFDFIEEKINNMPEFTELIQYLSKHYKTNIQKIAQGCNEITQSSFWLKTFIQRLLHEKLEDTLSSDSLIEYASLFKSELELSPLEYKYVYYLEALFIESDSIRINDNILIRKVQQKDLEYTRDIFFDQPRPQFVGLPSSILEIDLYAKDESECQEHVKRIFNALRMFKTVSVFSKETISIKKTIIWPMASARGWGQTTYSPYKKYTVTHSEEDRFVKFINAIEQKLYFNKEEKGYRTLYISIERYNSALLETIDIDRKLMTAVMGLESLFTLEKDRGENAFKLGVRVAKLLGYLNFNSEKVKDLIEESYKFRNKVVHGTYISLENKKRISELFPDILNFLRVSLIIFILYQKIGKDKIVELVDKSMISNDYSEKLREMLQENIADFREVFS